jgi:transcriptional regulator with XRE-family HTH domain
MTKIEIARLQKGITREDLAKQVGITVRAIEHYEHATREPRASILKKIAIVLDRRMEDLI